MTESLDVYLDGLLAWGDSASLRMKRVSPRIS